MPRSDISTLASASPLRSAAHSPPRDAVPLRVGYVVCRFDMGGLERVAAHLAGGLDRAACQPFIFCLEQSGAAAQWLSRDDVPIVELHKRRGNDPRVVLRFARALRDHRIDVIQSHNWGTLLETTLARRWAGTPVHVHAEHGQELDALHAGSFRRRLRNRASRFGFDRCDSVVVCAESVRQRLHERCGYPARSMHCILNGVDRPVQSPAAADALRRRLGLRPNSIVLGSLSRLVPVKDFGTAVAMLTHWSDAARDVHLVLVGDGPGETALRQQAAELGVSDRVHLVGRQDNIGDWLALFDIYLNSSLSEALSMGLLEAMSLGLPSVVTAVGDHPAVVGGADPCGLTVPAGSADALADAVNRLIENPELRRELGRCALERYTNLYTTERMVLDYASHYQQLASQKSAALRRGARV